MATKHTDQKFLKTYVKPTCDEADRLIKAIFDLRQVDQSAFTFSFLEKTLSRLLEGSRISDKQWLRLQSLLKENEIPTVKLVFDDIGPFPFGPIEAARRGKVWNALVATIQEPEPVAPVVEIAPEPEPVTLDTSGWTDLEFAHFGSEVIRLYGMIARIIAKQNALKKAH